MVGVIRNTGYRAGTFYGTKKKIINFHRIVAEHHLAPVDGKKYVNHIDGNKLNNKLENLEWVTLKENSRHAARYGLSQNGERSHKAKVNTEICLTLHTFKRHKDWNQARLANAFGVSKTCVSHIQCGMNWPGIYEVLYGKKPKWLIAIQSDNEAELTLRGKTTKDFTALL